MEELDGLIDSLRSILKSKKGDTTTAEFSPIFRFPFTDDYADKILDRFKVFPSVGRRWPSLYKDLIETEVRSAGVAISHEWESSISGYRTNCINMIADEDRNLLYVGKSEFPGITRILDMMVPPFSDTQPNGQKSNKAPEIWNDHLLGGKYLNCFFCYDIEPDPDKVIFNLLVDYRNLYGRLPAYNHKMLNKRK